MGQATRAATKSPGMEWLFWLSIMFEHMSIAQVRVNVSFEILTVNGSPKRKEKREKKRIESIKNKY